MNDSTNNTKRIVYLHRDCIAQMIPQGAQIMLREGTEVKILQDKGGSYTVDVYGNLARIAGIDADALGLERIDPLTGLSDDASVEDKVKHMLSLVYDPEIPVSILDLGLIYKIEITQTETENQYKVDIEMTLTAPGCGMGPAIMQDAKDKIALINQVEEVNIELVFEPPWDKSMMSEEAKLQLGMY